MKIIAFLVAGACALSLPGGHQRLHAERRDVAIETVTTTFYQTVVWVDSNGKPVSTEINNPPAFTSAPRSAPSVPATPTPPFRKRPGQSPGAAKPPQSPSQAPSQAPQVTESSIEPPKASDSATNAPPAATQEARSGKNTGGNTGSTASSEGLGICYDMIDGQTQCKSPSTIATEFAFLKSQGYSMVRVYDIGCPVSDFTTAAAANNLAIMIGLNSIANLQSDLSKLIASIAGNWAAVDTVYIGNELVNTGAASAAQVAAAVSTAKATLTAAGYTGSVITVDTFNVMMNDPTVCSTSDYCGANAHAFFDPNTAASGAGAFVLNAYNKVVAANGGKRVVITESGWPYQGGANGQAMPSVENQAAALQSLRGAGVPSMYLFQAYNAGYKQAGPLGVEQFFGIYDH